jgi:hypothetical protein
MGPEKRPHYQEWGHDMAVQAMRREAPAEKIFEIGIDERMP